MPPITREEAKKAIADQCGLEIKTRRIGKPHCEFSGFIFQLNLLGENRSGPKRAGFYYYSKEDLRDENAVVKPWLQDKLKDFGFSPEERRVRTNRSSDGREGHAADFYIDFPWDNPTDFAPIQSLYKRLRDFQKNVWEVMTEEERNKEIRQYNAKHQTEVRNYIKQRRGERPTDDEDDESEELSQDQDRVVELLKANLNVILTGAPGTGKTYMAKEVAKEMAKDEWIVEEMTSGKKNGKWKNGRIASVQFHPGYDYSDFVVGMKPVLISADTCKEVFRDENGIPTTDTGKKDGERTVFSGKTEVSFRWEDGIFKKFADDAQKAFDAWVATDGHKPEDAPKYVFLIDEINRADLSRVFGELFSLLEEEYRYPNDKGTGITLPNGENFVIPRNLYILGTMNDIDRSVESMDFALRRRFAWYEVKPDSEKDDVIIADKANKRKITMGDAKKLNGAMKALNKLIAPQQKTQGETSSTDQTKKEETPDLRLGSEYQLGGAIFAKLEKYVQKDENGNVKDASDEAFDSLWNNHIKNILSEYLRGRRDRDNLLLPSLEKAYKTAVGTTCQGDSTQDNQSKTPETQAEASSAQA